MPTDRNSVYQTNRLLLSKKSHRLSLIVKSDILLQTLMSKYKSWKSIAPLFANMMFGSWYMLVGGLLVLHMDLATTILTLFLGNIIAATLFYSVGLTGLNLRTSTYEIAKRSFGEYGSRFLISVFLVLARIGWVGVRAELGGLALAEVFGIPKLFGVAAFTIALIATTIGSFKKLSLYGWIALVATALMAVLGLSKVFAEWNLNDVFDYSPDDNWTILVGINVVIISKISFGAIVPDFFNKAKSARDVFLGSLMGFIPAGMIAGSIGAILTITTGTYDLVEVLNKLNLSFLAFSFLAVSSFAPATLFPAGVGLASIFDKKGERARQIGTIVAGLGGFALSMFGMLDKFAEFLNVLGIAFAPILGVILVEYYLLKTKTNPSTGSGLGNKKIDAAGLISWLLGAATVYLSSDVYEVGIACLNGLMISGITYVTIKYFNNKQ
ncbi:hypothetical protein GF389_03380 [Candidatus Dojkabacteria bacterium]|nr:hypothetical protein [Candidatus Dojkabacteria bacterium]